MISKGKAKFCFQNAKRGKFAKRRSSRSTSLLQTKDALLEIRKNNSK
jgi:hypothetical protein